MHNMTIRDIQKLGEGEVSESDSEDTEDEDASSDDDDYEAGVDFDVRDEEADWNDVMDRLDHMQCQDTHHLLRKKVQEKLWIDEGDDDEEEYEKRCL